MADLTESLLLQLAKPKWVSSLRLYESRRIKAFDAFNGFELVGFCFFLLYNDKLGLKPAA